jgi:hypothetical protein
LNRNTLNTITRLQQAGITLPDSLALRRIAMTLHRWFELECGDGNNYGSWAIERDEATDKPFMVRHYYLHGRGKDYTSRCAIPDREKGARKRLAAIMSCYPALGFYVQTDPRGAPLYILRPSDVPKGADAECHYNRGIAVSR